MNLLIARTCNDCGGKLAVRLIDTKPTMEDMRELTQSLGGMYCIEETIYEGIDVGAIYKSP